MEKQSRLRFEWTGGLWEDLYSTVSQTPPWWVMRDRWEERRRRWWWVGGALILVVVVGASLMTSSWRGLVDLPHCSWAALVPRTGPLLRSWTTEERDKNQCGGEADGKSVPSQPCREHHPHSDGHTEQQRKKQKWADVLQENIRKPETMSWWMKGGGWNRGGVRRRCRSDETLSTDLKTNDQVRLRGENDPCSGATLSSVELTQPVFTAWPRVTYSSVAEVPRTSPFWRIWCEIQEWTRLNLAGPALRTLTAGLEHLQEGCNNEHNPERTAEWSTSSSSFWVSSSIRLMSSMVKPTHLSIQQNSWRWKFVKIRFSCCERKKRLKTVAAGTELLAALPRLHLVDEVLHFGLQTPPSELDGDQLVRAHVRTFGLQLILWREDESWAPTPPPSRQGHFSLPRPLPSTRDWEVLCPSSWSGTEQDLPPACSPAIAQRCCVSNVTDVLTWLKFTIKFSASVFPKLDGMRTFATLRH